MLNVILSITHTVKVPPTSLPVSPPSHDKRILTCLPHSQSTSVALSSAEAPAGYPFKNITIIKEIVSTRGTMGRGSLSSLFPLPIVPRMLSFSFSPASPQHKEASAEERASVDNIHLLNSHKSSRDCLEGHQKHGRQ